jgi:hypothetical protein
MRYQRPVGQPTDQDFGLLVSHRGRGDIQTESGRRTVHAEGRRMIAATSLMRRQNSISLTQSVVTGSIPMVTGLSGNQALGHKPVLFRQTGICT